jgi:hypothetical protein
VWLANLLEVRGVWLRSQQMISVAHAANVMADHDLVGGGPPPWWATLILVVAIVLYVKWVAKDD